MMKTCAQCHQTSDAETEFYRSERNKDGRDSYCKPCRNGRHAATMAKQRESRPPVVPLTERTCKECGQTKKVGEFYRQRAVCKSCRITYHAEYAARPEVAARLAEQRRNRASGKWKRPPRREPHAPGFEVCTMCNEDKPLDEFHDHPLGRNGKDSNCKECKRLRSQDRRTDPTIREREHRLKAQRVYGLAEGEYDTMLAAQGGVCAICRKPRPENKRLMVDHCHETGKVRALLCSTCNTGLGAFRDDTDLMRAAIAYLDLHRLPSKEPKE